MDMSYSPLVLFQDIREFLKQWLKNRRAIYRDWQEELNHIQNKLDDLDIDYEWIIDDLYGLSDWTICSLFGIEYTNEFTRLLCMTDNGFYEIDDTVDKLIELINKKREK